LWGTTLKQRWRIRTGPKTINSLKSFSVSLAGLAAKKPVESLPLSGFPRESQKKFGKIFRCLPHDGFQYRQADLEGGLQPIEALFLSQPFGA
jgi:hypothetical protein